jgi:hypothetical protein
MCLTVGLAFYARRRLVEALAEAALTPVIVRLGLLSGGEAANGLVSWVDRLLIEAAGEVSEATRLIGGSGGVPNRDAIAIHPNHQRFRQATD